MNRRHRRRHGFTLVEIMIVSAIICLLAAVAVPAFVRAHRRSQATRILNDLRSIASAVDQYALENHKVDGMAVDEADWKVYLKHETKLYVTGKDAYGNDYGTQFIGEEPRVPSVTKAILADVADDAFWSPYQ